MNLDTIKEAIADLPAHERMALAMWLTEQQMDAWDKQMLQDFSAGGRGMHLVEKIRGDIRAGKFKPIDEDSGSQQ
jgi:hypothetical protein